MPQSWPTAYAASDLQRYLSILLLVCVHLLLLPCLGKVGCDSAVVSIWTVSVECRGLISCTCHSNKCITGLMYELCVPLCDVKGHTFGNIWLRSWYAKLDKHMGGESELPGLAVRLVQNHYWQFTSDVTLAHRDTVSESAF